MSPVRCLPIIVLVISLLLTIGCENRDRLIGSYEGYGDKNERILKLHVKFGADGQGSWSIENSTVPFKWEMRGSDIWLHTREGGVVQGRFKGDTIEINLPGVGDCHLKRSAE
jgi:hypothetical protein